MPPVDPTPKPAPKPTTAPKRKAPAKTPTPRPGQAPAPAKPKPSSGPAIDTLTGDMVSGQPQSGPPTTHDPLSTPVWGNPDDPNYAQQNIVQLNINGLKFSVNEMLATQFAGFIRDLIAAGYHPKAVQGYNNRPITGGTGKSNHAYGAAIDIDPESNPRVASGTAKHAIPDAVARDLAKKWGLFWGGDYTSSKDYMHFEALGAPRTPGSPAGGTTPAVTPAAKAAGAPGPVTSAAPTAAAPAAAPVVARNAAGGAPTKLDLNNPADFAKAAAQFGFIAQLAKDVPDIGLVLKKAVAGGWDVPTFTASVQDTPWYKKHTDAQRAAQQMKSTNPGEYQNQLHKSLLAVQQTALQAGVHLTDKQANDLAYQAVVNAWDATTLNHYVSAELQVDKTHPQFEGDAGDTYDRLLKSQADYGLPADPAYVQQQVLAIAQGKQTEERVVQSFQQHAKNMYPGLSKALDAGQTVKDYASPYLSQYASDLELAPGSVDLRDPLIQRALQSQVTPAGSTAKGEPGVMPLWQFQQELRNDPRYEKTTKFRDSMMDTAMGVLRNLGLQS